jgi:hypothetical protein
MNARLCGHDEGGREKSMIEETKVKKLRRRVNERKDRRKGRRRGKVAVKRR